MQRLFPAIVALLSLFLTPLGFVAPAPATATLLDGIPPWREEGAAVAPPPAAPAVPPLSLNLRLLANVPKSDAAPTQGPDFQSDLAFRGNLAFAGNYDGFRIIDISKPNQPVVVADVSCRGPQNDVSVWGDILILSVDQPRTSPRCDSLRAVPGTNPRAWEGLRIFSVQEVLQAIPDADGVIRSVNPIAAVATDCGSHTHTAIPDPEMNRLLVYVSSYPLVSGPRCGPENAAKFGYDPLHRKISIVEIPLSDPTQARVIATPAVDVPVFDLADFGIPGFNPMIGCHDIQVFLELKLAAAACASVGQIWDISNPANPKTLEPLWTVDNPNVHFYHSAAFTWDGQVAIFGDEVILGTSCQSPADLHGRLWFYQTSSGQELGSFLIPRAQGSDEYCTAHLFNVLKKQDRYVLVSSWYRGGTSVVDFTDPAQAQEIGFYDPGPFGDPATDEGAWSSYWYNGIIYSNNFNRGVDIFRARHPAVAGAEQFDFDNPQTQLELLD